jgi:16S rRNA (cytosine1402-N4)-methyltransferase
MVYHQPVLSDQVTAYLGCRAGRDYIDCTLGGGGHAAQILEGNSPGGRLLGIDWDPQAIRIARSRLKAYRGRVVYVCDDFSNVGRIARERGFAPIDGILADLGVSSFQLEDARRGFSFMAEGPLDMRMNPEGKEKASDLINRLPARELETLLRRYGEERWARRISQSIERQRHKGWISTTKELRDIVHSAIPASSRSRRIDPATQTFMALRIALNRELDNLKTLLAEAPSLLKAGGRICIISFHSLEDRLVKQSFRMAERGCTCRPDVPRCVCGGKKTLRVVERKAVTPSQDEIRENPRARSAKLRVAERI